MLAIGLLMSLFTIMDFGIIRCYINFQETVIVM